MEAQRLLAVLPPAAVKVTSTAQPSSSSQEAVIGKPKPTQRDPPRPPEAASESSKQSSLTQLLHHFTAPPLQAHLQSSERVEAASLEERPEAPRAVNHWTVKERSPVVSAPSATKLLSVPWPDPEPALPLLLESEVTEASPVHFEPKELVDERLEGTKDAQPLDLEKAPPPLSPQAKAVMAILIAALFYLQYLEPLVQAWLLD